MKKIVIVIVIITLVILGIVWSKSAKAPAIYDNVGTTASTTLNTASSTLGVVKTYTMAEIAMHKDITSCYTAINGEVFDLTAWIGQHPGGDKAILSICGIDGTKAFTTQHGGKAKQEMKLETFKIGNLALTTNK